MKAFVVSSTFDRCLDERDDDDDDDGDDDADRIDCAKHYRHEQFDNESLARPGPSGQNTLLHTSKASARLMAQHTF